MSRQVPRQALAPVRDEPWFDDLDLELESGWVDDRHVDERYVDELDGERFHVKGGSPEGRAPADRGGLPDNGFDYGPMTYNLAEPAEEELDMRRNESRIFLVGLAVLLGAMGFYGGTWLFERNEAGEPSLGSEVTVPAGADVLTAAVATSTSTSAAPAPTSTSVDAVSTTAGASAVRATAESSTSAPAPDTGVRSYSMRGGIIVVSFTGEQIELVSVTPAEGFTAESAVDEAGVLTVSLRNGTYHSQLVGSWDAGPQVALDDH